MAHDTLPRLYIASVCTWQSQTVLDLSSEHVHYLRTVLRKTTGDLVRVFDGKQGEWLLEIDDLGKKNGTGMIREQLRPQSDYPPMPIHLYFAPLKKHPQDMITEKSTELGVTDLTPVITERTNTHKIRTDKMGFRIIEASEQCERLTLPTIHPNTNLSSIVTGNSKRPLLYCAESGQAEPLATVLQTLLFDNGLMDGVALLVGPEGGFTPAELSTLKQCPNTHAVSLGPRILRAETAVIAGLSVIQSLAGDWQHRPPRTVQ